MRAHRPRSAPPAQRPGNVRSSQAQIPSTAEILEAIQARQSRRCPTKRQDRHRAARAAQYENATRWVCFFGSPRKCRRWCSVPDGTGGNPGGQPMCYGRVIAAGMLIASAIILPTSEASARCWHNGWGWRCGPGLLALPFVAAGAVVAGAAAIATAPVRAIVGPPYYYAPPPAYYAPPAYAPPAYYPPAYYYGPPPR